jgi:cytochrome b
MTQTIRVWDMPTRIFHWALALNVGVLFITGEVGGAAMVWHFRLGYLLLSLLLFRIIWGLVGGYWSRFSSFLYSPQTILGYLKGERKPEHVMGHNPLGSGSVFMLLGILGIQVASGLFSDDEIAASGPLSKFVSNAMVSNATFYHKDIGKLILIALVFLHVGAILFYLVKKRENLIRPMIMGDKHSDVTLPSSKDDRLARFKGALIFILCGALVSWGIKVAG